MGEGPAPGAAQRHHRLGPAVGARRLRHRAPRGSWSTGGADGDAPPRRPARAPRPVGIGTAAAPTPAGEFFVRNRLTRFRSPFYGPVAFGTSARSATLTDWPGGGFVGIHGTDRPDLLPGRVSHGCIRMRNADILRLARLMPIGTPVSIR